MAKFDESVGEEVRRNLPGDYSQPNTNHPIITRLYNIE